MNDMPDEKRQNITWELNQGFRSQYANFAIVISMLWNCKSQNISSILKKLYIKMLYMLKVFIATEKVKKKIVFYFSKNTSIN